MTRAPLIVFIALALSACSTSDEFVLTIVGTNDVHGQLQTQEQRGGLVTIASHVENLRRARAEDGCALLLVDAGDMWQGTLESNLTEGASVVAAFNALGYAAAAIGNHEFDFGPLGPKPIPEDDSDDPNGALKQRAKEAAFPLLSANLIDKRTGRAIDWENVEPSTLIDVQGIAVGVVGVMTIRSLQATIAANVAHLEVTPLAPAIEREAKKLRDAGAAIVIVLAHAGGRCMAFSDPYDLSSCGLNGEIFRVAEALPPGLVDHIVAGHVHDGIAHVVNGIAITSSYSNTRAFSRVDFVIDRSTGVIDDRRIFPPQPALPGNDYEGRPLTDAPAVTAIAKRAAAFAADQKSRKLGIHLATPFTLEGNPESALGNLFTDALLESIDADIAIHNVQGGLRSDLPAGDLTFGAVYELSPFENRVVVLSLSGAELRQIIAAQAYRGGRRIGFSGLRAAVHCEGDIMSVELTRTSGEPIADNDTLRVIVNDYMAFGGDNVLNPIMPAGGFAVDTELPMTRDVFIGWLSRRGGVIRAQEFLTTSAPKWIGEYPKDRSCRLP